MNKKDLNERDICSKFITPAILKAGWDLQTQIREEVRFTKGRIIVRGKLVTRGKDKRADYILYYKPNIPIAIVEAKDNLHPMGAGLQQGLDYSATLDIPFVFATNGDGFVFHDKTLKAGDGDIEKTLTLDEFPSPAELWEKYRAARGLTPEEERIVLQDYHDDGAGKEPRYYQANAINATVEAIATGSPAAQRPCRHPGESRGLARTAVGGRDCVAAPLLPVEGQGEEAGVKKRILYLADRNVLIDQTMVNDFRPFGPAMAKLSTKAKTIEKDDGTKVEIITAQGKHHIPQPGESRGLVLVRDADRNDGRPAKQSSAACAGAYSNVAALKITRARGGVRGGRPHGAPGWC